MELSFLWLAELLFVVAYACFLRAFALRRETDRHRGWALVGAGLIVASLVVLEVVKRGLGWEFPIRSRAALRWHISCASFTLLLLVVQVWTGITRRRAIHVRLWPVFLGAFAATIVLSLVAFRLW